MRADARISSPFSEIKLPVLSSCGIFVGENKCLDQGTVLLHGGEDEAGCPVCASKGTLGATEPAPWFPGIGIHFPGKFLLLCSAYSHWDFSFFQEICQDFSPEIKRIFSKFYLQSAI